MPSINVQELFEKFMQDPEYIGKEELALAEAKQRAIQSMNNHKALSMAKMDSSLDLLTAFLQKGEHDFVQRSKHATQMSHIVSHEVREPTHEEILQHFKDELIAMAHPDVQNAEDPWQAIVDDPTAAFANSPNLTDHHNFLGEASKGVGGISPEFDSGDASPLKRNLPTGQAALTELARRAKPGSQGEETMKTLQGAVDDFASNQHFVRGFRTSEEEMSTPDEATGKTASHIFSETPRLFAPRTHESTGEKFVDHTPGEGETTYNRGEWEAAFKSAIDPAENFDDVIHQDWGGQQVRQGTKKNAKQLSAMEHSISNEQGRVIDLVRTLTGKTFTSPKDALSRLRQIRENPEQFIRQHPETGKDLMRVQHVGDVKHLVDNTTEIDPGDHVRSEYESARDNHLQDIVSSITGIEDQRSDFDHPPDMQTDETGVGWKHEQPLSPLQQFQIHNAQHPSLSSEAQDGISPAGRDLMNKVQQQYNRSEHGTPEALTALFNKVIGENGFSFPSVPADVNEREARWPKEEYPVKDFSEEEIKQRNFPEFSERGDVREARLGELADGQYNRIPIKADREERDASGARTPNEILDDIMNAPPSDRARVEAEAKRDWNLMTPEEQEGFVAESMAYFGEQGQLDDVTSNLAGMSADSETARLGDNEEGFDGPMHEAEGEGNFTGNVKANPNWKETGDFPFVFLDQADLDKQAVPKSDPLPDNMKAMSSEERQKVFDDRQQAEEDARKEGVPVTPETLGREPSELTDTVPHTEQRTGFGGGGFATGEGAAVGRGPSERLPLDVSEGGSAYAGEHQVILHNQGELGSYSKYRGFMRRLTDYGIPLEDLTNETSQGNLVWSKESMLEGMRQHGLLHHGQNDYARKFSNENKPGARVSNQGVAPIFPASGPRSTKERLDKFHESLSPEQREGLSEKAEGLKQAWNAIHQSVANKTHTGLKPETPYDRSPNEKEEFSEASNTSQRGLRPDPSSSEEFDQKDSPYRKVQEARYGPEDPITGETPLLQEEEWSRGVKEPSNSPSFKRTGGQLGSFSDGRYLNHIIKDIAEKMGEDPPEFYPPEERVQRRNDREQQLREAFDNHFAGQKNLDYGDIAHYFANQLGVKVPHPKDLPMGKNLSVSKDEEDRFHQHDLHADTPRYDTREESPMEYRPQQNVAAPSPNIDALKDFLDRNKEGDTPPTVAEVQEVIEPLKEEIKEVDSLPEEAERTPHQQFMEQSLPAVQQLIAHVDEVVENTPANEPISTDALSTLEQHVKDSEVLSGEVIPRRAIEGGVDQPPEDRIVEGTSRVINGDSDEEANQPVTEETPPAEESPADAVQIERVDKMTPELARANPDKLYLFGDNEQDNDPTGARKLNADGTRRQGSQAAGQAWIRHEDNAHGIRTKGSPSQHWTAEDHDANIAKVDEDFKAAIERARAEGKSIVIPRDGFGTGRAELGERSPETLAHINKRIQELEEGNFSVADGTPAAEEQPAAETPAPSPTPSPTGTTGASQPFYDEEGYTPPSVHPVAAPVPQNIEDIRNSYKQRIEGFWEMVKAAPTDPRWYDGTFGRAIEGGDPAPHKADTRAQFRGRGWSRESNEGKLYGDLRTGQTIPKEQANANLRATHRNDLLNEARAKIQQHAQLLHDDSSGDANIANEETGEFLRPHLGEHIEHDPELTRTENWGEGGNPNDQDSEYENRALPPPVEGEDSGEPVSNEDEIADPTGEPTTSDPADWINSKDEIINKLGLPEDRREWTGEQIKQYASGLADLMKSRVKDEAGRKYIDWMAKNQGDLTVDPRGDHLKTVRSPDTPVQFSYGFPMKIEKMVDELSGERELSIGELGNWGNHNSIKWAFSPFGRWDAGTLEDAETGKNVKRSRSVDEYKPELLEGISKRDREQVEQLEALPYEDRTGADFESAREISNRALRNTSVGRVIHWGVTRDHRFINQARRKHTISQDQMNARHSDYADGVHSEINDLAAHMNSTGYHDGTASPEDKEHIDNKLMSLASEVSRSKVTDPQEALKILTTDKNHLGTKRSHHDAFSENGFTSDMHNELHGHQPHDGASDRAEQDESSDESFSAEIEGAEEDPEVKALPASPDEYTPTPEQEKQIALIQGRIDTKQKRLNNENIKFHEARDRVQELANNLNAKEANNEEILPSEKTQYEVAKRAAISANTRRKSIANEINTHIEEIDNQRKPATTTTTPPKEEPPKEEPPKEEPQPTEESEEEKTKKAQEALDLLARQGLISSSAHEKMSRQIKPQASPKESSFEPDSPLHPNNWRGMYEKEDENALEAALERLGKSDYNHESLEHWLGNPAGRKQIIAEANRHAGANLHTSNDQDTAKVRQDNIKEINRLRAKRNDLKPLDEETLGHSSFDVAAHLKTEQKADIKWENERSERESKNIIAQKPTSLQSRIDERLAVDPQADPNAQISPREATEQFRHVVGQAHQLSLIGGTFARGGDYEKHYAELDTLGNEALKHGADWERIRKEMADHTKDGVLQSSFGSPEHLADAKAYHDTRDAHTADYQSLFAPGSQKAVDAWNDSHYHPNARIMPTATQNEDGSFNIGKLSDGDVRRDKYDPISKKWSTTTSNIQDTLVANRHNGIRTDVNSAPHILGMSPEQREEHDSLHKEIQATGGANLPISPSQRARKTALTDSLIESGHITEDQRYTKDNPLNHPAFGADATDSHNTGITSGMTSETVPDGHHFVPGVGHVKTDAINTIQKTLKPGEAFYHPGDQKGGSLVSNPDGSDAQKGIMVDHNGVHAVGTIASEASHDSHGPITNQHIRETDLANGLHVATGNSNGITHKNVTEHDNGFHIKNVSQTLADSGSHFGTSPAAADHAPKPPEPSIASKAGGALGRFASKVGAAAKPAADTFARAYTAGDGMPASSVKQQTFKGVAQRGLSSLLGRVAGESSVAKITGMTPTQASQADTAFKAGQQPESLEKLIKFVKSEK